MREIKFRAWVECENVMIRHREVIERSHLQFDDDLGGHKDIVMQYTGLKDKNDKEIYEGDILEDGYTARKTAVWDNNRGAFIGQNGFNELLFFDLNVYEIIGNIHENPELINK